MGKFGIKIEKLAENDLKKHFKAGNKATISKINKILVELSDHPYTGTGNPEQLKYDLHGFWSRRINQKDRMVYKVNEHIVTVYIISAMGHYSDK